MNKYILFESNNIYYIELYYRRINKDYLYVKKYIDMVGFY